MNYLKELNAFHDQVDMQRALKHNKRFFQYCEGILNRWQSLGVKSIY
ncbi:DnaD domain protein [Halobacillus sp. B23F22_1]